MKNRIDVMRLREGVMTLNGWVIPQKKKNRNYIDISDQLSEAAAGTGKGMQAASADGVRFSVLEKPEGMSKWQRIPFTYVPMLREDVAGLYGCSPMCGFDIQFAYARGNEYALQMEAPGSSSSRVLISDAVMAKRDSVANRKKERILALCTTETVKVAWDFFRENGLRALWKKSVHKLQGIEEDYDYSEWYEKTKPTEAKLRAQAAEYRGLLREVLEHGPQPFCGALDGKNAADFHPMFSITIPAYNTPEKYLCMLFDSLKAQTYPNFEVILADGSDAAERTVEEVTRRYAAEDPRFRYERLEKNWGISENTNAALELTKGDYIVLCDHDDELTADALYEVVQALLAHPEAEFLYTDEDKVDFDGKALFEPHFKSDYNPDLLRTVNYICHLSVIRRDLLLRVQEQHPQHLAFDPAYDGAQDHDFFLRCTEEAAREERAWLAAQNSGTAQERKEAAGGAQARQEADGSDGGNGDSRSCSAAADLPDTDQQQEQRQQELRAGIFTSDRIVHIPKVCYHWRCHKNSTAKDPSSKLYAFDAGKRAVLAHEKRLGIGAEKIVDGITYGFYHTVYPLSEERVSVIIPNKDHVKDLDKCIRSLLQRSLHRNLEIIVVENNSSEPETFDYYQKIEGNPAYFMTDFDAGWQKLCAERRKRAEYCRTMKGVTDTYQPELSEERLRDLSCISIRVVRWEREFNYSAINNFGVAHAEGEYLLLLNNDVELISPDSITEMLGYARRPDVGIVGARLLYEDDTVQHAGVVVGFGGIAGGAFIGLHERENSYMHRMMCVQDLSAVTAACLMTKRSVFDAVGGLTEELAVAFNDIDYCMKVRAQGLLCVYDPYVLLHHYESKSRGLEDTPEKVRRFNNEIAVFADRWGEILKQGDPYYNPNLTLRKSNFSLRDLSKEKIGEPYKLELDVEKQLREVRKAQRH